MGCVRGAETERVNIISSSDETNGTFTLTSAVCRLRGVKEAGKGGGAECLVGCRVVSLHRRFWAMSEPTTTPVTRVIPASSHFLKLS